MYKSEIIQAIHDRIMSDESAREALAADIRKAMRTSMVNLMINLLIDYYKLPVDFFRDVSCEDLGELGMAIIGVKEM